MVKCTVIRGTIHQNGRIYSCGEEEVEIPEKEAKELKSLGFINFTETLDVKKNETPKGGDTKRTQAKNTKAPTTPKKTRKEPSLKNAETEGSIEGGEGAVGKEEGDIE